MDQEGPTPEQGNAETTAEIDTRADLGILLVHGIGQNRSGDTLVRFGEPLVKSILDWVGLAGSAHVEVVDAVLCVDADEPTNPARTRLRVEAPSLDGSGLQTSNWLVAESWWAESFISPPFSELANWSFKIVPWTAYYHFHRRFTRAVGRLATGWQGKPGRVKTAWPHAVKVALEFLALIIAVLLAPLLVTALASILLLGMIPIPRLRAFVDRLQRGEIPGLNEVIESLNVRLGVITKNMVTG